MQTFVPLPSHLMLSDGKVKQILETFCGRHGFFVEALPIPVRVAVFCALLSLVVSVPPEMFDYSLGSILSIIRFV